MNVIVEPAAEGEWSMLGDAYQAQVRIVAWEAADVLKAPVAALFRSQGKWAAFTVHEGRSHLRLLDVGHRNDTDAELLGGLDVERRVVLFPSDKLSDRTPVVAK